MPSDPRVTQGGLAFLGVVMALLSWQYGYEASVRGYRADAEAVATQRDDVNRLETMVQAAGGPVAWLVKAQQRISELRDRFPAQAQLPQLLDELVATLGVGAIKLADVTQGNLEPVREAGSPLLVDGRPCLQLPVTLKAEGRYHPLLEALESLTAPTFPALVSFEQIELQAKDAEGPALVATVKLHLYVLAADGAGTADALQ